MGLGGSGKSQKKKEKKQFVTNSYTAGGEGGDRSGISSDSFKSQVKLFLLSSQILVDPCSSGCTKPHAEERKGEGVISFSARATKSSTPPPSGSEYPPPCKPRLSALTGHAPRGHPKHGVYGRPGKLREEGKGDSSSHRSRLRKPADCGSFS